MPLGLAAKIGLPTPITQPALIGRKTAFPQGVNKPVGLYPEALPGPFARRPGDASQGIDLVNERLGIADGNRFERQTRQRLWCPDGRAGCAVRCARLGAGHACRGGTGRRNPGRLGQVPGARCAAARGWRAAADLPARHPRGQGSAAVCLRIAGPGERAAAGVDEDEEEVSAPTFEDQQR